MSARSEAVWEEEGTRYEECGYLTRFASLRPADLHRSAHYAQLVGFTLLGYNLKVSEAAFWVSTAMKGQP